MKEGEPELSETLLIAQGQVEFKNKKTQRNPFPQDPCFPIAHEKGFTLDLSDQGYLRRRKMRRPQTDFGRSSR